MFLRALYAAALALALEAAPSQTLLNHVPKAVAESRQVGPVAETTSITLAIGLPLRNSAELDILVQQIADPASVNYRHYLTAGEFAEEFGPTQQDYDKLIAFVEASGFTVSGQHSNRMILDVTGSAAVVNRTLHINLTVWHHPTRGTFFAPDRAPSLDTEAPVLAISGLDNFLVPQPMDLKVTPLTAAKPLVTGSGPASLFIGNDFRAAYAPAVTLTGSGQKIGLVEFDGFYAADVVSNFKQAGLPAVPVSTVLLDGFNGKPGGSNIEVILDIVMAGYMAPGASVIVYEGYYPDDILNRMATDNLARQLSCSWGYGIDSTTEQIFKEMIAQGQSFFTASGDSGAYSGGVMPPADDPNVTSVGGTALTTSGAGGAWQSESAWSGSGGGVSTTYPIPSYQQGMNMTAIGGSNTMRNMPDVALTGAVQMFLIYNNGAQTAVGGTSAATPLWAAFTSLANQQAAANAKPAIGFMNPTLYAIGNNASNYAAAIHDISNGNTGFAALPGFDLTTGWGSPTGQALINDLSSIASSPSFTLSAAAASVVAGSSATSTIQMTAQNSFSATVTLSLSGLPSGVLGTFGAFSSGGASVLMLASTSAATPGTYAIVVKGVSGTISATTQLSLTVTATPGFTLTTSAAAVAAVQGSTAMASIAIAPVNGFNSTVALTISGLPAGVTAAFSPASATTTSTLTFTAASTAVSGTATVTITGKSGSLSATTTIALTVAAPASYSLSTSTPTLNIKQGASATSTITLTPKNGFTGKVTLATSPLPLGVTVSFNPASTATTSVATFSATATAAAGSGTVTVTGTSGATSASAAFTLTVQAGPSFTLAASPASLSVIQGAYGSTTLTTTPLNGFTGTPVLSISGLPSGVTAAFTGTVLKLTAAASAAPGLSTLTVTGTSGALTAQTSIALTIAPPPSFKLSAASSNVTVAAGGSATTTISINQQTGFSGTVTLTATGLPAGVLAAFGATSGAGTSTLTLKAASATPAKASQITVTGTSGSFTSSITIALTITAPPDFAIALLPSSLQVVKGGKGASAIWLTPLNGFSGTVTLSASAAPAGVTALFTTANVGSLVLFSAGSNASAATTQVTITATSGALTHTAILSLTVVSPSAAIVDLSPFYNVSGSAVDTLPFTGGGLDAGGRSYSGVLLGASQTVGGTLYSIGPMGLPDAVTSQTVTLPAGVYASLNMLATGLNGNEPAQKFTVTYTDGSTSVFTQSMSDWFTPQNYSGETQAIAMNYRDNSTGTTDGEYFHLYSYSFALNTAKTVRSITLPQNRNVVVMAITLSAASQAKP